MSDQPLGREEVARIAIALKGLNEHRETPLNDLIEPARKFLLACERVPTDPDEIAEKRWIVRLEAAKLITGNLRPVRAISQFDRYLEFLSHRHPADGFFDEDEGYVILTYLPSLTQADHLPEWFCNALKEKFSDWRKFEFSKAQSVKGKKSKKAFASQIPNHWP